MTVFIVRTYTVKPDKYAEHLAWGKKLVKLMKRQPKLFSEVLSMRVLSQKYGGNVGGYTAMWKFKTLSDVAKWEKGFATVKEEIDLRNEFLSLIVPGSYSECVWESVQTMNKKPKRCIPKK